MRISLAFAAFNGFCAVAMGAIGSHALAGRLSDQGLDWLSTAERYQMWHALALALVAVLAMGQGAQGPWLRIAAGAAAAGLVLFSGSLYLLALTEWRPAAMATPMGGAAFLAGWLALLAHALTAR